MRVNLLARMEYPEFLGMCPLIEPWTQCDLRWQVFAFRHSSRVVRRERGTIRGPRNGEVELQCLASIQRVIVPCSLQNRVGGCRMRVSMNSFGTIKATYRCQRIDRRLASGHDPGCRRCSTGISCAQLIITRCNVPLHPRSLHCRPTGPAAVPESRTSPRLGTPL